MNFDVDGGASYRDVDELEGQHQHDLRWQLACLLANNCACSLQMSPTGRERTE